MKVFVGMETSGAFRRRFAAAGCDVLSCDILPAEDGASVHEHLQGDVFDALRGLESCGWVPDLAVFHPSCTYLTNSAAWAFAAPDYKRYPGVGYHQRVKAGTLTGAYRQAARDLALADVRRIMALPIRRKVIENPIGAIGTSIRKPDQIVQPYEFGDDASKATCLWFCDQNGDTAPEMRIPLEPTARVSGRLVNGRERWANQTDSGQNRLSPGNERWKDRSRTYPGIADAAVKSWLSLYDLTADNDQHGDIFA